MTWKISRANADVGEARRNRILKSSLAFYESVTQRPGSLSRPSDLPDRLQGALLLEAWTQDAFSLSCSAFVLFLFFIGIAQ